MKIERYENDFIRKYSLILSRFPNLCVLSIETDMKMNFKNKKEQQLEILEKLVEANQDYLFRFAYFRVGSREVAEDIVQNVFLKLIENCIDLSLMKSPRMYLFKMVSNRCIDYQRRETIHHVPLDEVKGLMDEDEEDVALRQEYERIVALLDNIPFEQAEIIRMNTIDNLSFVEIAELLDLPVSTVKSRFVYGVNKVRAKLNGLK